jgi:hypothetical protein
LGVLNGNANFSVLLFPLFFACWLYALIA